MVSHASWALQKAVVTALRGDASLSSVLGGARVFDHVPQRSAYPFVSMGVALDRESGSSVVSGVEHVFSLHVWSKARGRRQSYGIMKEIRRLLHEQSLSLPDHVLVNLRLEYSDVRLDPGDGEVWHGVMRFRAVTEPL